MKTLLTTMEFIFWLSSNPILDVKSRHYNYHFRTFVQRYAELMQRPLELGMFVPCDEEGNVLEKPDKLKYLVEPGENCPGWDYVDFDKSNDQYYDKRRYDKDFEQYQQAKERVLFEGYSLNTEFQQHHLDHTNGHMIGVIYMRIKEKETIEDIVREINIDLTPTPSLLKQIGIKG